ncbi:hypothetical protein [Massilia pseudoviolaceinigra]|uniref:hypothetical protein n=1 Tax=Massilia pseudoviolaceinigra TaxID=3057165 RepID=UPI0027965C03|nr:hypothetical protein [Massilia sp. CCM 9206]MDQ1918926.1 hypothetical protein [Massilia sp. CCM 9206]
MARDTWAYRDVAVESYEDARTGALRIRPMAGQAFAPSLRVQCARALADPALHPAGTRFLLSAKLTDRLGGTPFLYAWHGDPVVVLSAAQAKKFLAEFRRGRI